MYYDGKIAGKIDDYLLLSIFLCMDWFPFQSFPTSWSRYERLLALTNATAQQVTDIIRIPFIWLRWHLTAGIDYHKNLHPKKPNASEIIFTTEGVRRLLELVENPPPDIYLEDSRKIPERKRNKVGPSEHTLGSMMEQHGFSRYYWSQARRLKPEYFGGWAGTRITPYVKAEHLSLVLELITLLQKQAHFNVQHGMQQKKPSWKRV